MIIDLPKGGLASIEWTLPRPATFVVQSGWTGDQSVGDLGGTLDGWRATVEIVPMYEADLAAWRGFFANLRGVKNSFLLEPTANHQRRNPAWSVRVRGGGLVGASVPVRDCPPALMALVSAGDIISIRNRAYIVKAPASTNSAGQAVIAVEPPVATALTDGDEVRITRPLIEMRLADPRAGWTHRPGPVMQPYSFQAVEVRP